MQCLEVCFSSFAICPWLAVKSIFDPSSLVLLLLVTVTSSPVKPENVAKDRSTDPLFQTLLTVSFGSRGRPITGAEWG